MQPNSRNFSVRFVLSLAFIFVGFVTVQAQQPRGFDESGSGLNGSPTKTNPVSATDTSISLQAFMTKDWSHPTVDRENNGKDHWPLIFPAFPQQSGGNSTYVFPSAKERFKRYARSLIGPLALVGVAASAGIDQWNDQPPEWGQGASGYGKRFASSLGQNAIQQTVSYGLSEAFRMDTGFVRSNRHGFGPRLADALEQNVTSRTHSGKRIISVPLLTSFYVGGLVPALTWYPARYSYKDGLRAGTYSLATGFGVNVLREFILHR